ncbi:Deoxyribonuclease [Mizuhopecten yessoensis]|uniref:Deoxyribonuclease n=1 Tax=Mizuhopecten yessoensis TaxID=6573 RepID=A0A210R677_MIZYE|nr:Deoxyribonuclease [Mizuhopecten yessoensis]
MPTPTAGLGARARWLVTLGCAGQCPKPAECRQQVTRDQVTTLTTVLQGAVVEGGGRPVIIHCKDGGSGRAAQEALGCFRRVPGASTLAVHWHCYTGSVEDIEAWRQLLPNLHIGVTALSLRAPSTRLALGGIDPSRLLLESDTPYLVPTGAGVGINSPWLLRHTLEELASLRGDNLYLLASQLNANARGFYSFE